MTSRNRRLDQAVAEYDEAVDSYFSQAVQVRTKADASALFTQSAALLMQSDRLEDLRARAAHPLIGLPLRRARLILESIELAGLRSWNRFARETGWGREVEL